MKPALRHTDNSIFRPAAFGRLCVETLITLVFFASMQPAAFGRLCVETGHESEPLKGLVQPPSGGCVLKPSTKMGRSLKSFQPPSGGCVLKHTILHIAIHLSYQPPSGGCVLKLLNPVRLHKQTMPAAFGRLCVETMNWRTFISRAAQPPSGGCVLKQGLVGGAGGLAFPAAFGRLCVETNGAGFRGLPRPPAAFGRLCVETGNERTIFSPFKPAAFGRLCVETVRNASSAGCVIPSRLRAAVC